MIRSRFRDDEKERNALAVHEFRSWKTEPSDVGSALPDSLDESELRSVGIRKVQLVGQVGEHVPDV